MPYRPPIHQPIRADRPGRVPRPSQAGSVYNTDEWKALRLATLKRDHFRCQLVLPGCERRATIADHVVPRSAGGVDALYNLRATCRACHNGAHPEKGGAHA